MIIFKFKSFSCPSQTWRCIINRKHVMMANVLDPGDLDSVKNYNTYLNFREKKILSFISSWIELWVRFLDPLPSNQSLILPQNFQWPLLVGLTLALSVYHLLLFLSFYIYTQYIYILYFCKAGILYYTYLY